MGIDMGMLLAGLALWSIVHLVPSLAAPFKAAAVARLGAGPWRALVSLLLLASLALIVVGFRAASTAPLYAPLAQPRAAGVLMLVALVLFFAPRLPTNIKRFLRHPQLTGVVVWSVAHLLVNGEARAVVLFGALGAWALIEIVAINRRDGAWIKPEPVPGLRAALPYLVGAAAWALLAWLHPWIAGVPVLAIGP
jgi:uncharacterized membrane protein